MTRGPCPHGRQRSRCKDCGGQSFCEHGRLRYVCKDCGGSQICVHGRQLYFCKDCGGNAFCEHGRQRNQCKDCGGTSVCVHGRRRSTCKDCGGASVCVHGRRRSTCKDCGGASVCVHGRERRVCKDCGGVSICVHGRQRYQCKDCGGKGICVHGRQRYQCKDCSGKGICVHGRERCKCKDCGGGSVCVHGRRRTLCKECGGGSLCVHGRRRDRCKEALCCEKRRQAQLARGDHRSAGAIGQAVAAAAPPRAAPSCFCRTEDGLPAEVLAGYAPDFVFEFDGGWVLCDACMRWCHTECVGLSEAEAEARGGYTCPRCCPPPADDDCGYTELGRGVEGRGGGGIEGENEAPFELLPSTELNGSASGDSEAGGEGEVIVLHAVRALPASWPPLWRVI